MQQPLPPYVNMEEMAGSKMEMPGSTTVTVEELPPPPPRDHLVWSLCSSIYGNFCCLGLLAFFFSVKSRDSKVLGDFSSARSYGSTAKCLNITALVTNIVITIIVIIILAVVLSSHSVPPYG